MCEQLIDDILQTNVTKHLVDLADLFHAGREEIDADKKLFIECKVCIIYLSGTSSSSRYRFI